MTDHDPMLDGITRYDSDDYDVELPEKSDGAYVLFSDLPSLIERVREDERGKVIQEVTNADTRRFAVTYDKGYAAGTDDERTRWMSATEKAKTLLIESARAAVAAAREQGRADAAAAVMAHDLHSLYPTITEYLAAAARGGTDD